MNNIFVNDDYRITCIIDWIFYSAISFSVLLMTPDLSQSCDELNSLLIDLFKSELNKTVIADSKENKNQSYFFKLQAI